MASASVDPAVVELAGGPSRLRVIALFGAVLALSSSSASTVGAVAPQLEHALHIGNTKIGLLSAVALLVGALFVIPVGLLVDRYRRIPMLSFSILLWSGASAVGALTSSYGTLLLSRLALGAVTATAGPAIASLTGDYFPARERGRVYSYILGGEVAGTAAGFIISGSIASLISWRAAFVLLAVPGVFLARSLWRTVPEPVRGGQSRLDPGVADAGLAHEVVRRRGVDPDPRLVLSEDPDRMGLGRAIAYTLRVTTNRDLIVGSALGYFFLSGLQTFAVLFVRGHYHSAQGTAEVVLALLVVGAVVGTLVAGRLTDALLRRGALGARVYVPAVCYLGSAGLLVPGLLSSSLLPAIWFDLAGAALLSGANPGLDAARLDIMPARLWGRAESARTVLRSLAQAVAPLAFGGVSDLIAGIAPTQVPLGTHPGVISPSAARGLEIAFLIMLTSLVAAGLFLFRARRTYPRDVATAAASQQAAASEPVALGS
jgi:MFS family permease